MLTANQRLILEHAVIHNDGEIVWFPPKVARMKILNEMLAMALVVHNENWMVSVDGLAALGYTPPVTPSVRIELRQHDRVNTKKDQVIHMLRRPEGATVSEICAAMKWTRHMTHCVISRSLKQQMKLNVVSANHVYRIAPGGHPIAA